MTRTSFPSGSSNGQPECTHTNANRIFTMQRYAAALLLVTLGCGVQTGAQEPGANPAQLERDEIFSLATMTVVARDWQDPDGARGHNIGAVLVNRRNQPVFWARNAVAVLDDATQHGEMRLIQQYLQCPGIGRFADGHTVYTSLEPCAMCAGTMAMTRVNRVVYVQADSAFGNARAALAAARYPRLYREGTPDSLEQKAILERGWEEYRQKEVGGSLTDYLRSEEARNAFASAEQDLLRFQVRHEENEIVLESVMAFLEDVTTETYGEVSLERCPVRR